MPKYYFYKLTHDNGGAPCVSGDLLSLAICKPMLRRTAEEGDIIIGFAAKSLDPDNRLIYVARVSKRLGDGKYFKNADYRHRSDCIYSWGAGAYHARRNARYHGSPTDLSHDLGKSPDYPRANVLLSKDFCYFGAAGSNAYKRKFPAVANAMAGLKQGHRVYHSPQLLQELQELTMTTCSLKGPHILGTPSQPPSRNVCLRGGGCWHCQFGENLLTNPPKMKIEDRIKLVTRESPYVANAIKHIWLSRLLQLVWEHYPESKVHIFQSEVDDAGHDVVLTWRSTTRHIQLKASHIKAKRTEVDVHSALAEVAGGCVIWMFYDPVNLNIRSYRFFGSAPTEALPGLDGFRIAKRVFPNMDGIRPERKRIRSIPKGKFEVISTLEQLATRLFGMEFSNSTLPR